MPGQANSEIISLSSRLRDKASALLSQKADGFRIADEITRDVDEVILSAYSRVADTGVFKSTSDIALLAVGGYGRREMMPYSDIDLMLLARDDSKSAKDAVQSFLYRLWDLGLNISHSFRTLRGCVDDAMKDLYTRTAMIDCRYIAGSRQLYDDFARDNYPKLLFKGTRNFTADVIRDAERRHKDTGESLYLLEPNVKESRGGLRDIHSISWLARSEFRINSLEEYRKFLSDRQYQDIKAAHNFLLKMRACIHVSSGRKNDQLLAELQDEIASLMEFRDTKRYYASEIMMRVFYMRSKSVADTLKKFVGLCGTRYFKLPKSFTVKKINEEFFISKNEIIVKDSAVFKDTSKIIEAFRIFSATGKMFSLQVEELLKKCAFSISREGRASRSAILHFREILRSNRAYETLRKMHDTCVLDRFIPEFGRIRHLIILESFHRYTVDEHTLMAIRSLENLKKTSDERLRYLADILKTVNQEVLYAAILFHDIGKGVSRKHEEAGYIIIRGILERLLFDQAERQMIEFLVRNHIVLAIFALSRDIYAPETIVRLAEIADNEENLNALYLMTYADMSAVNPSFWNEWKASLLRNLYNRTIQHLSGIIHDPYASLEDIVGNFAKKMPERYLLSNTPEEIKKDHDLAIIASLEKVALSITEKNPAATEIIVVTGNVPGLIPAIIGILSKRGLNIISARLFTGERDLVICKITLSNWRELFWDGMEAGIVDDLKKTLLLPGVETQILSFTARNKPLIKRSVFLLEIDNETNDRHTILEVMLPDKIGLLYDIAIRLRDNKIDILSAMINTDDGMAHDVFYVQKDDSQLGYQECMNILRDLMSIEASS